MFCYNISMLKNPYINALVAVGYIGAIVLTIGSFENIDGPDTLLAPMVMISLLVLSVAVMSALFFYQPGLLFLEGKKEEALKFFSKTLATFACLTGLFIVLLRLISVF